MRILGDVWRVEYSDGQADNPDPDHLEDPEAEEGEKFVALVVEAVVLACLDDAEEEEAGETGAPEHEEEGVDNLAGMMVAGECERDYGEDDEIGATCEVCWRVDVSAWYLLECMPHVRERWQGGSRRTYL